MPVTSGLLLASIFLLLWKMIMEMYLPRRVQAFRWLQSCTPQARQGLQSLHRLTFWKHFVHVFLHFKRRKSWFSKVFFPKWEVPGAQRWVGSRNYCGPESGWEEESSTHGTALTSMCCLCLGLPACGGCSVGGWSLVCWVPSKIKACRDISWDKYTGLLGGQSKASSHKLVMD